MSTVLLLALAVLVFLLVLTIGQRIREFFFGLQISRNERAVQKYLHG